MKSQVIVPLDGSANAEAMLPHALFFARETQSVLTLLRVIMPPGEPAYGVPYILDDWYAGEVMWTRNYLDGLAARLQPQGVRVQAQHVEGVSAGGAITDYAVQHAGTRLIALASNGRGPGGRLLFGNVAGDVFATAPTSLLLLVAPLPAHLVEEEVLVDDIVGPVQRGHDYEAKKRSDFLEGQAEQLRTGTGLTVETAVDDGNPTTFIERFFGKQQQHLLIVTTREQAERKVMGFLHRSNAPVLFLHAS